MARSLSRLEVVSSVGNCVKGGFGVGIYGGWEVAGSLDPDGHGEGKEFWCI